VLTLLLGRLHVPSILCNGIREEDEVEKVENNFSRCEATEINYAMKKKIICREYAFNLVRKLTCIS
jgi:hypothetical protein